MYTVAVAAAAGVVIVVVANVFLVHRLNDFFYCLQFDALALLVIGIKQYLYSLNLTINTQTIFMISLPVFDNTLHWYSFVVFRFFMARFFFCAGAFVVSGYFSSLSLTLKIDEITKLFVWNIEYCTNSHRTQSFGLDFPWTSQAQQLTLLEHRHWLMIECNFHLHPTLMRYFDIPIDIWWRCSTILLLVLYALLFVNAFLLPFSDVTIIIGYVS